MLRRKSDWVNDRKGPIIAAQTNSYQRQVRVKSANGLIPLSAKRGLSALLHENTARAIPRAKRTNQAFIAGLQIIAMIVEGDD